MKISSSSNAISKMKAPSSTSISSVGVSSAPSRTRESVVTLNYSGARSSSDLTLIESNVPKKRKLSICILPTRLITWYPLGAVSLRARHQENWVIVAVWFDNEGESFPYREVQIKLFLTCENKLATYWKHLMKLSLSHGGWNLRLCMSRNYPYSHHRRVEFLEGWGY